MSEHFAVCLHGIKKIEGPAPSQCGSCSWTRDLIFTDRNGQQTCIQLYAADGIPQLWTAQEVALRDEISELKQQIALLTEHHRAQKEADAERAADNEMLERR